MVDESSTIQRFLAAVDAGDVLPPIDPRIAADLRIVLRLLETNQWRYIRLFRTLKRLEVCLELVGGKWGVRKERQALFYAALVNLSKVVKGHVD